MMSNSYRTSRVTWSQAKDSLIAIREQVFIQEQKVPAELELDEYDATAVHLLAYNETDEAVGTVRLLKDGHIGRMAVLPQVRGRGIGSQLLNEVINLAKTQGLHEVYLYAQTQAVPFYLKHHFQPVGKEFMEAGIAHLHMRREIAMV